MARGFGATLGAGSTDSIVSALDTASPGQRSYFIWFYLHGAGGGSLGRIFDRATGTAAHEAFFHNNPALTFAAVWSTTAGAWNIVKPSADVWHSVLITYDRGATTNEPVIYLDGSSVTVTQQGVDPSGTFDTSTQSFVLGNRAVDGARNWDGNLAEFAVWDNVLLGAAEAAALNKGASPLSIRPDKLVEYIPVLRANHSYKRAAPTITGTAVQPHPRIIMPRSAKFRRFKPASTAKVLIAGSGSYSISGTAASLLQARKVVAAAGSYALTGTDAALRAGKTLAAGAGSYAITGTNANLLHASKVTAVAGSYAINGTAATLLHQWKVTVAAGAYTINGTDAALTKTGVKLLVADPGSYTVSGTATGILHGWKVPVTAGSYAINGQTANLKHGWKVTAAAGAYSINGQAVTLRRNIPLVVQAGAYNVNGATAALKLLRKIIASSGIYLVSGTDATVTKTLFEFVPERRIAYSKRRGVRSVDSIAPSRSVQSEDSGE
jgi:hypothetical protein